MRTIVLPLRWAKATGRPACIGQGRVRGVKALGVRYENSLAKALPWAKQGQWFEYADGIGQGWCQVDLLWKDAEGVAWVVEVKHSWVPDAEVKLCGLYLPVVAKALKCEVKALVACKLLRPGARHIFGNLEDAMRAAREGNDLIPTWQWFGRIAVPEPGHRPEVKRRQRNDQTLSP